tara:strand:+ start:301 stop:444 length:144 start_codon:yes stop_codon:yes gene_type:complete
LTDPVATNSFAVRIPSPFSLVTVNVATVVWYNGISNENQYKKEGNNF